jgi:CHAT domain-containing protein
MSVCKLTEQYTQSLSMYAMVQARVQEYAKLPGRKSLLAVGAAQYQPSLSWTERGRQLWMDIFAAWGVGEKGQTPAPPNTQTPVNRAELAELVMRGGDHGVADAFKRLDRKWPNIPSALEEIQTLARLFPDAALYTGEHATEAQLQALNQTQALTQYRYFLLATHGFLHPDYPFLNAIVLGQLHNPPGTDGYVTASEWAGYQLQSDLMVLSACETGLGEVVPGEGILGLPFAMYVAGNTNVVMSLWKVFDRSTADFMARFFEKLKTGVSQVRALNDTKREFLAGKRYRQPVFWAPFILYGA